MEKSYPFIWMIPCSPAYQRIIVAIHFKWEPEDPEWKRKAEEGIVLRLIDESDEVVEEVERVLSRPGLPRTINHTGDGSEASHGALVIEVVHALSRAPTIADSHGRRCERGVASWLNCFPDFARLRLARAEAKGAQEKQQFRNYIEGQIEDALEQSGLLDGIVEQFTV